MTKEDILKKYPNYISQQKPQDSQPTSTSVSANQKFKPVNASDSQNPEQPTTTTVQREKDLNHQRLTKANKENWQPETMSIAERRE